MRFLKTLLLPQLVVPATTTKPSVIPDGKIIAPNVWAT